MGPVAYRSIGHGWGMGGVSCLDLLDITGVSPRRLTVIRKTCLRPRRDPPAVAR